MRSRRKQKGGNMEKAKEIIELWKKKKDTSYPLDLTGLKLTHLPSLPENLKGLYCSYNKLKDLPDLPSGLLILLCDNNELIALPDHLPNSITTLECNKNHLTYLPLLPDNLHDLDCSKNNLPEDYKKKQGEKMSDYISRVRNLINSKNSTLNFSEPLEVYNGAKNYVSLNSIESKNELVNLPRNTNKYNSDFSEFIKYNTFINSLHQKLENPITKHRFKKSKIRYYTAKIKNK